MADLSPTNDTTQSRIVPDAQVQLRFEKFAAFVEEYRPKISLGGMFLETANPKPLGSTISCEFKLTDGFRLCRALGEVVWIRRGDAGPAAPAGMGIRFEAIDDEGRELILKILEEQVKSGGEPFEIEQVPAEAEVAPEGPTQLDLPAVGPVSEDDTLSFEAAEVSPLATASETAGADEGAGGEFDAPWGDGLPEFPEDVLDPVDEAALPDIAEADFSSDPKEAGFALDGDSDLLEIEPLLEAAEPVSVAPEPVAPEPVAPEPLSFDELGADLPDFDIDEESEPGFSFEPEAGPGADAAGPGADAAVHGTDDTLPPSTQVTPPDIEAGPGSAWRDTAALDEGPEEPIETALELGSPAEPHDVSAGNASALEHAGLPEGEPALGSAENWKSSETIDRETNVRHSDSIDEPLPDLDLPIEGVAAADGSDAPDAWEKDAWEEEDGAWDGEDGDEWEEEGASGGFFAQLRLSLVESKGRLILILLVLGALGAGLVFKEKVLSLVGLGAPPVVDVAAAPGAALEETGESAADATSDTAGDEERAMAAGSGTEAFEMSQVDTEPELIEFDEAPPPALPPAARPPGGADEGSPAPPVAGTVRGERPPAGQASSPPRTESPRPARPADEAGARQPPVTEERVATGRPSTGRPSAGRPATRIRDLTHQQLASGTIVTIWLDGSIDPSRIEHQPLAYDPLKEQLVIRGIGHPYASLVEVGTLELDRIRTGLHGAGSAGAEIRLVFDLSSERMTVGEVVPRDGALEITVQRRR